MQEDGEDKRKNCIEELNNEMKQEKQELLLVREKLEQDNEASEKEKRN